MTTNKPTPTAIPIVNMYAKTVESVTCLVTIMMLGSATVIKAPNANENAITINKFFCLESEEPIYSPTLLKEDEAPIENVPNPVIRTTIPIRSNQ